MGIPVGFLLHVHEVSMESLCGFPSRDSIVFLLDFYALPMRFLLGSSMIP